MKSFLFFGLLCAFTPPLFASSVDYPKEAIEILAMAAQCPSELGELAKVGQVTGATHVSQEDVDQYIIGFSAGGYAPNFQRYAVGNLTITRTWQPRVGPQAPDAPGGSFAYTCKVNYVR